MSLSSRTASPALFVGQFVGFLIKTFFFPLKSASRFSNLLMSGLRKILQLGILTTISNKEGKTHSIVNETFHSGSTLSGSNAACFPSSSLCKSGCSSVTFWLSPVTDDLHMDSVLASSDLSVWPSSRSPAVDSVLFRPLAECQTWEGPYGPSSPVPPQCPEMAQCSRGGEGTPARYMGAKAQPSVDISSSSQPSHW